MAGGINLWTKRIDFRNQLFIENRKIRVDRLEDLHEILNLLIERSIDLSAKSRHAESGNATELIEAANQLSDLLSERVPRIVTLSRNYAGTLKAHEFTNTVNEFINTILRFADGKEP